MNKIVNILLVEDDTLDQIDVRRTLEKQNILHRLTIASNGEDALTVLNEFDGFDIILMDINMPRMNGFELAAKIKSNPFWRHIKIFMLTTSEEPEDKARAQSLDISGFITKPLKLQSPGTTDAFHLMIDLMNFGKE